MRETVQAEAGQLEELGRRVAEMMEERRAEPAGDRDQRDEAEFGPALQDATTPKGVASAETWTMD